MTSEKEFNKKLFPENLWVSPSWVIKKFSLYLDQYEQECGDRVLALVKLLKHRNTKKLKEMWAGAVFLLGYEQMTASPHWLKPSYDEDPDVLGVCFVPSKKLHDSHDQAVIFIEITEWEKHSTIDLLGSIKKKLRGKFYPNYYHLVVHITRIGNMNTDLDFAFDELSKLDFKIAGIWILVNSPKSNIEDNHAVICLFPKKAKYEFSLSRLVYQDSFKKIPPVMAIEKKRGWEFYDLSTIEVEIPLLD